MYCYTAYGLGIHSALPLPELIAVTEVEADVVIRLGKVDLPLSEVARAGSDLHVAGEEVYLFWDQVGMFLVRNGREIVVAPSPTAEEQLIRVPLLGTVLTVLLHQRGVLVLHGSAISTNDAAVAFLGFKGSGKSTIAGALYARGCNLIADDVVALDVNSGAKNPIALPGCPQLKLWPKAVAASLGEDPEELPRLHSQSEKRARQVTSGFVQRPVPLRQIYMLDKGSSTQIEPLPPQEAAIQLVANSHAARLGQTLFRTREISHFFQCAELTRNVPIYRLKWPLSLAVLPTIVRLVEEHFARDIDDVSV